MHFAFRKTGCFLAVGALLLCCSCEKHELGEMPTVQREHVDLASGSDEDAEIVKERPAAPASSPNPTPAEFFPAGSPR
jgi:hypothetical protein